MKTLRIILIAIAIITGTLQLFAQDRFEALKFSERFPQSDARAMGAGNAFGAVGANLISSSINPGSLALYKKSEFSFSLGFLSVNSTGNYLGTVSTDHRYALNLPQVGLAIYIPNSKNGEEVKDGWVSYTLSGTINRMNSFQANRYFEGTNTKRSVLNNYADRANGTDYKNLNLTSSVENLAWQTYLINTIDSNTNNSYIPIDTKSQNFFQQNTVITKGSNYDINLAFAGNYADKIFIGAAISFPTINFNERRDFTETNLKPNLDSTYISSDYSTELDISGTGVQVSFGIVVKPIKFIRIGGSIQSPAYYSLHAAYNKEMTSSLFDGSIITRSAPGEMDFNFTSPFRATGSLAFIAGKYGFLAVDYEFVDYSQGYLSSNNTQYTKENNSIDSSYTHTTNLRIGGELKLGIFAIRAGYGITGNPYKSVSAPQGVDASAKTISFGIGMREKNYYVDFAFQQMKTKELYLPPYSLSSNTLQNYKLDEVAGFIDDITRNNFLVTFGFKF